ncbi:glycosyltransferase, partial [Enterobacter hormaechei]|uniref:glycosyltransferase n=1 Tax=Enterobacter hormaechei TaxID=158836 RepID=UPI00203CB9CD
MPDAPSRSAPAERIGVALCTYNGARYLQAQLDSILDQDLPVNEVMIGDDGSSDQTLQLLHAARRPAAAAA